jgi:hypothetical protein
MIFDNHNILLFVLGKSSGNPNLAVVSKNMSVPTVTIVTKPQVPSVVWSKGHNCKTYRKVALITKWHAM